MEVAMGASIRRFGRIEPERPLLLAAWPGMGNVAYGAAAYLKDNLPLEKFAELDSEGIFYKTGVQIKEGLVRIPELPRGEFYFYKNRFPENEFRLRDILLFIGESQPVMEKEYDLALGVVEVAKQHNVGQIITFAATPVNITHHSEPAVWAVSTDPVILQKLPGYGLKIMSSGHIGGLNGLLLGVGKEAGIDGVCFLGEIPFYTAKIENPKSSLAIIRAFMRYTGIEIDTNGLRQMAVYVEEEIDKVSKSTKQTLFGKEAEERPRKENEGAETSHDVVPHGIREKIEFMFEAAGKDISRAGELKKELDKWELFGEYEDRFLDLFGEKNL
jgi:proteasome assembly chaperone (PAC2) family protein